MTTSRRVLLIRLLGGTVALLLAGLGIAWGLLSAARQRTEVCNSSGGWWDDDRRRCYFKECQQRAGEVQAADAGWLRCYVEMPKRAESSFP